MIANKRKNSSSQNGFTLIELSIVLMIVGLMMASFMGMLNINMQKAMLKNTKDNIETVRKAMQAYYVEHRHFPCPASISAKREDPDFGKARAVCLNSEIGQIERDKEKEHIVTAFNPDDTQITIGIVPFRSLGIPDEAAKDGWGNILQFAVTTSLTDSRLFNQMEGAIDVIAEDGQSRLNTPFSAQYVILSTGPNAVGGYTGELVQISECNEKTAESQNCNNDATFLDMPRNKVGPDHENSFDDMIYYQQYDPDLDSNGGLVFRYKTECMHDFSRVDFEGEKIIGLVSLAKDIETLEKKSKDNDFVLCYSSKYSVFITNNVNLEKNDSVLCPEQWTFIGYKYFQNGASARKKAYAICAR